MKKIHLLAALSASALCTTVFAGPNSSTLGAAAPKNVTPQVVSSTPGQENTKFATSGENFTCDYLPNGAKAAVYVPYALCWNVVCDTTGPNATTASCKCPIYNGPGWGTVPCDQRAAAYQAEHQIVYSEFSARYLLTTPALQAADLPNDMGKIKPITMCQNDQHVNNFRYADCWNQPCKPNADGKTANCDCVIVYALPGNQYITEADNCSDGMDNCQKYSGQDPLKVVNGADLNFGPKVVTKSLDYYLKGGEAAAQSYFEAAHCEKNS